jgi:hypothetical protein
MSRPLGVTILAILALISGIFGLLGGVTVVFLGGAAAAVGVLDIGGIVAIMGVLTLALAVVSLALAYGFWTLKPWAWQLGIILEVLSIGLAVLQVLFGGSGIPSVIISIVVAGIIIYYLNTPAVRKAFGAPETGFPIVGNIGGK